MELARNDERKEKRKKQKKLREKRNKKGIDRPSSELISTMLTFVWTIACIWREEGADETGDSEMDRLRSEVEPRRREERKCLRDRICLATCWGRVNVA